MAAPREVTPPPIQAPTAKEKKYDRQLRLWAASGQRALEESHVLMIMGEDSNGSNSTIAGTETLKNLILPSIGQFTVADSSLVNERDLGVNFFLESSSLNRSRAEEITRLLQELNPDVTGHFISKPLAEWLPKDGSLTPYNIILLCAPISLDLLQRISQYAQQNLVPIIYIQSVGFYSSFSIQLPPEFPIVDTHPDPDTTQDLRLLAPWPELEAALDSIGNPKSLSDHDHGHIPYIFLLLYYLKEWRSSHNNTYPSNYKEKVQFREFIQNNARTNNPEGGEENYDEACAAVLKSISEPSIGGGCKEMFQMSSCSNLNPKSANFWIIANAVKSFYESHGVLPLPGSVPDMKATSAEYIKLQNIYKSKARADVAEVTKVVRNLEKSLSRTVAIPDGEIEGFCKNAAHIRVLINPDHEPIPILRLADSDPKTLSRIKKLLADDWEDVMAVFIGLNSSFLDPSSLTSDDEKRENINNSIAEFRRAAGGELHNISSITGGMVAQEVIKLITKQYIPVDGTCIFDGIRSKSGVFKI